MYLDVSKIYGTNGDRISFELSGNLEDTDYVTGPVNIKGAAESTGSSIFVSGKGEAFALLPCDRCLETVNLKLSFDFSENFTGESESCGVSVIQNKDSIDLGPVIKEAVISAFPMKILCKEDCKGLCSQCGTNLNHSSCDCDASFINPKFDALRSLFNVE